MTDFPEIRPRRRPPPAPPTTVTEATDRELAELRALAPKLANSTLAATARALALELDDPGNSATSKSMIARSLLDTLDRIRELTPEGEESDALDDLAAARAKRLAGGAAATG